MRVGCRRLRSDLRTFAPLLDAGWADGLRDELSWLADVLGAARDAEVLRARLQRTAAADPLAPLDAAAVARIDADARRPARGRAGRRSTTRCASDRYVDAARRAGRRGRATPQLTAAAESPADRVLPRLVARPWRQLADGGQGRATAPPTWTRARRTTTGTRYASGASGPGTPSRRSRRCSAARRPSWPRRWPRCRTCSASTRTPPSPPTPGCRSPLADPDDHALAVTAGRLYERERAAIRARARRLPRRLAAAAEPTADRVAAVTATPIRAAGGVVWRAGAGGAARSCLVHRAALRRLVAAQGQARRRASTRWPPRSARCTRRPACTAVPQVRLPTVRYLSRRARRRRVDYWSMRAGRTATSSRNDRGRRGALAAAGRARRDWLSYAHDARGAARTSPRCRRSPAWCCWSGTRTPASASTWSGPDAARPLDADRRRAGRGAGTPAGADSARYGWSRPRPARCVQTLEPARRRCSTCRSRSTRGFDEPAPGQDPEENALAAAGAAARLAAPDGPAVVCSQGKVMPAALARLLGEQSADRFATPKGDGWLLAFSGERAVAADRLRRRRPGRRRLTPLDRSHSH